jgi:hypothetical protein
MFLVIRRDSRGASRHDGQGTADCTVRPVRRCLRLSGDCISHRDTFVWHESRPSRGRTVVTPRASLEPPLLPWSGCWSCCPGGPPHREAAPNCFICRPSGRPAPPAPCTSSSPGCGGGRRPRLHDLLSLDLVACGDHEQLALELGLRHDLLALVVHLLRHLGSLVLLLLHDVEVRLVEKSRVRDLLRLVHLERELEALEIIRHLEPLEVDLRAVPAHVVGDRPEDEVPGHDEQVRAVAEELVLEHAHRDVRARVLETTEDELDGHVHAGDDLLRPGTHLLVQHERLALATDGLVADGQRQNGM